MKRYDDEIGRLEWAAPQDLRCRPGVLSAPQPRPGRPLRRGRAPHRSPVRTDLTMADVIAEAHDAGQLALIPLAEIA